MDVGVLPPSVAASGWTPTVTHIPVVVDGELSAAVQVYVKVSLEIAIEAFGMLLETYDVL